MRLFGWAAVAAIVLSPLAVQAGGNYHYGAPAPVAGYGPAPAAAPLHISDYGQPVRYKKKVVHVPHTTYKLKTVPYVRTVTVPVQKQVIAYRTIRVPVRGYKTKVIIVPVYGHHHRKPQYPIRPLAPQQPAPVPALSYGSAPSYGPIPTQAGYGGQLIYPHGRS